MCMFWHLLTSLKCSYWNSVSLALCYSLQHVTAIKLFSSFRRLNAELEAKTADLVRQAEEVIVSKCTIISISMSVLVSLLFNLRYSIHTKSAQSINFSSVNYYKLKINMCIAMCIYAYLRFWEAHPF